MSPYILSPRSPTDFWVAEDFLQQSVMMTITVHNITQNHEVETFSQWPSFKNVYRVILDYLHEKVWNLGGDRHEQLMLDISTCVDVCKILKSTNVDKSWLLSSQLTV